MIDDKKIEEAATVASISNTEKSSVRESYVISALADHESSFREGYIEGAKWAINEFLKDLWHPVSEEPEENKKILVQYTNDDLETDYEVDMNTHFTEWKQHAASYKFMKWCYIEDVLQKGV